MANTKKSEKGTAGSSRDRNNGEIDDMVTVRQFVPTVLLIISVVFGTFAATAPAHAQMSVKVDTALMKTKIEEQVYKQLEGRITGKFEEMNAITRSWGENAAFRGILQLFSKDPALVKAFKEARKEGKSPRQAFKAAIKKANDNSGLAALGRLNEFIGGENRTILLELGKIASSSKKRLTEITTVTQAINQVKDRESLTKILKKNGFKNLKEFEALEKRLQGIYDFVEKPFGTYYSIFQTIHKGVEGKEPGARALALFTLMDETAGTLPVLGGFVQNYMEVAKELLNATLRLRKAFAKWDMGCVGTGTYGFMQGSGNTKNINFKFPGTACPEGNIKGLYVDLNRTDILYYWDEKKWHKAPDNGGGINAIRKIFQLLKGVKIFQSEVKVDVLAAFKFYGLTGGFESSYNEALKIYGKLFGTWSRLKRIMARFGVPPDRAIEILEARAGIPPNFDTYIEKHFRKNQDIFIYRYLVSLLGDGNAAQRHKDTLSAMMNFRPKIVLGTLDIAPGLKRENFKPVIDISQDDGVQIERQEVSDAGDTYQIIMFGDAVSRVKYSIVYGPFRSKVLKVFNWSNIISRQVAHIEATLEVSLGKIGPIEIGQPFEINGKIKLAENERNAQFGVSWSVNGKPSGKTTVASASFTIPLMFKKAGIYDFEVTATDQRGVSGGERTEIPVAFKVDVQFDGDKNEDKESLVAIAKITGGSGSYSVRWRTNTGFDISKDIERDRFFERLKNTGPKKLKWVELTVFDKTNRIEVPLLVTLDDSQPMEVRLSVNPTAIKPGENATATVNIIAGKPEFDLVFFVNGKETARKKLAGKNGTFTFKTDRPGDYKLRVVVTDKTGAASEGQAILGVRNDPKPLPPPSAKTDKITAKGPHMAPPIPTDLTLLKTWNKNLKNQQRAFFLTKCEKWPENSNYPIGCHSSMNYLLQLWGKSAPAKNGYFGETCRDNSSKMQAISMYNYGRKIKVFNIDCDKGHIYRIDYYRKNSRDRFKFENYDNKGRLSKIVTGDSITRYWPNSRIRAFSNDARDISSKYEYFGVDGTPLDKVDRYPKSLSAKGCFERARGGGKIRISKPYICSKGGDYRYCSCSNPNPYSTNGTFDGGKECSISQDAKVVSGIWSRTNNKTGLPILEKFYDRGLYCGERRYHPRTGKLLKEIRSTDLEEILKARSKRNKK